MIGLIGRYSAKVNELSLVVRCALLISAVLLAASIALPIAGLQGGSVAVQAAATAAAVCLTSGLIAVVLATRGRGTPASVAWILAGDGIAMAGPLVTAVGLQRTHHPLDAAGFFGWVVVFFLATLLAKTLLVAPLANMPAKNGGAGRNSAGGNQAGPSAEAGV